MATANVVGNPVGSVPSSGSGMDFDIAKVKAIGTPVPPPAGVMITGRNGVPPELWAKVCLFSSNFTLIAVNATGCYLMRVLKAT